MSNPSPLVGREKKSRLTPLPYCDSPRRALWWSAPTRKEKSLDTPSLGSVRWRHRLREGFKKLRTSNQKESCMSFQICIKTDKSLQQLATEIRNLFSLPPFQQNTFSGDEYCQFEMLGMLLLIHRADEEDRD